MTEKVLHPVRDNYGEHFSVGEDGRLDSRTQAASFNILLLNLNRRALNSKRLELLRLLRATENAVRLQIQRLIDDLVPSVASRILFYEAMDIAVPKQVLDLVYIARANMLAEANQPDSNQENQTALGAFLGA